ncbi:nicotinate-nucleotide adenylyltransferase [Chelatococcus sambhunathii]|uniref:Probable nicotinate-nucleotide adenylyltransferase n=1 Tax=Chelatococcus sambhunathii TaxID=363953 RepID=A0ABU1DFC0_9HYPH|nr:nicotinate-nucleotide adenylyltransferase [Chelatococcus sambhunathii]MDR4306745.1 nicotinate-nucleotide adenylyltransferase [Chelatococcus sambhunathii]
MTSGRVLTPKLPPAAPGMAIGLYGGSFNPPHEAHRKVALTALKRLGLDRLWVLVTPGNPLKAHGGLAPLEERITAVRALIDHPRVAVTGVEQAIGTSRTCEVLGYLRSRRPEVAFVWVMGADNLIDLHRWGRWRRIVELAPVAVIDRPGSTFAPLSARAAKVYGRFRVDESDAPALARTPAPAWCFLHGLRSNLSSTALRGV